MTNTPENDWNAYSKLVLKELETLAKGLNDLSIQISELKQEIAEIKSREERIHDIYAWKTRIDEIASPSQLADLRREVTELNIFKTKAVTIFAVVQFLMALAVWFRNFV